jgi:hypothetical protein
MANPTTNYGWPMPTSTDLVTDLPADFDAFGQPVDTTLKALNPETTLGDISYRSAVSNTNTRLAIGTAGQVLAVSGGVPAWTTTADVTPLTTKGDLFTFTTEDARIGVGADGTVLTAASGEATGLQWAAPAAGGKVLQVVNATTTTDTTIASATLTDTTITATITPTLATSNILVMVTANFKQFRNGAGFTFIAAELLRGATVIGDYDKSDHDEFGGIQIAGSSANTFQSSVTSLIVLDSPATTSATTYKLQARGYDASVSVDCQQNGALSTITLLEIGA